MQSPSTGPASAAIEDASLHRGVITLGVPILLLHLVYGVDMILPPSREAPYFAAASVLFALVVATCLAATFDIFPRFRLGIGPWPAAVTIAAAVAVTECYFALHGRTAILAALTSAALQAILLNRKWYRLSLGLSACLGTWLALNTAIFHPTTAKQADMLPIIQWALDQIFQGHDPYTTDHSAITPGQLYYLPAQLLVFMPFRALGIDTRLTGALAVIAAFAITALLLTGTRRRVVLALLVAIAVSKPSVEIAANGHLWPMWLCVTAFAALVYRQQWRIAAIILGVLLAFNQTMLCVAALAFAYRLSFRPTIKSLLIESACVLLPYALFVAPFVYFNPNYLGMIYVTLPREAGMLNNASWSNNALQMSLNTLLHHAGLLDLRAALQAASVLLGMAVLALPLASRRDQPFSPTGFLWWTGVILIIATALNVQVWKYYYIAGFILMSFGVKLSAPGEAPGLPARD